MKVNLVYTFLVGICQSHTLDYLILSYYYIVLLMIIMPIWFVIYEYVL